MGGKRKTPPLSLPASSFLFLFLLLLLSGVICPPVSLSHRLEEDEELLSVLCCGNTRTLLKKGGQWVRRVKRRGVGGGEGKKTFAEVWLRCRYNGEERHA